MLGGGAAVAAATAMRESAAAMQPKRARPSLSSPPSDTFTLSLSRSRTTRLLSFVAPAGVSFRALDRATTCD